MPHYEHGDASDEISRLQLVERCRKRAASDELPLRQIFDSECREAGVSGDGVSFAMIESSMYKRRRISLPALPSNPLEAGEAISGTRFASVDGVEFYRGTCTANAGDDGVALLFASDRQLSLLENSSSIFFDATFKVVPSLFYQMLTIFATHGDGVYPVMFVLMSRKTTALYHSVFVKVNELVPHFAPANVMADFEEASTSAFRRVFGNEVVISGCWFHYGQAIIKKLRKIGLTVAYGRDVNVKSVIHCLLGLPLLPENDILQGLTDIRDLISTGIYSDASSRQLLDKMWQYVHRQWVAKSTVGPSRLSVRNNSARTNNVLESFHASLLRRIKVSHPNLFVFLGHLQRTTMDSMSDVSRMENGLRIRRPRKKALMTNDSRIKLCIDRYDGGRYSRIQFLRAVSHSLGAHTQHFMHLEGEDTDDDQDGEDVTSELNSRDSTAAPSNAPQPNDDNSQRQASDGEICEVCLNAPRDSRIAFVPCGHARFCASCAATVTDLGQACPICRASIHMTLRIF